MSFSKVRSCGCCVLARSAGKDPARRVLSKRITDRRDGSYWVQYSLSASGVYRVSVNCIGPKRGDAKANKAEGVPLPGSPWIVLAAQSAAYPPASVLLCDAHSLGSAVAGKPINFEVSAADAHGNRHVSGGEPWQALLTGPYPAAEEQAVRLHDCGDGRYRGQCSMTASGEYALSVTLRGGHAKGSPLRIVTSPSDVSPGRCLAEGAGLHTGVKGQPAAFTLVARDQYKNHVPSAKAAALKFCVQIKTPLSVIAMKWKLRTDPSLEHAYGGKVELVHHALARVLEGKKTSFDAGEWAAFGIQDLLPHHFVRGKSGQCYEPVVSKPPPPAVLIRELGDGTTGCEFVPTERGQHTISVTLGGIPIEGSEFTCNVE